MNKDDGDTMTWLECVDEAFERIASIKQRLANGGFRDPRVGKIILDWWTGELARLTSGGGVGHA